MKFRPVQEDEIQFKNEDEKKTNGDVKKMNGNGNANGIKNGHNTSNGDSENYGEPIIDPDCNPNKPKTVLFSDISAASVVIKSAYKEMTPCTRSSKLSPMYGMDLYFKKEYLQETGAFKERGNRFALSKLTEDELKRGVIAASSGNHALGISYHGRNMGIPVTVVMPVVAPLMKIEWCRSYGATVIVRGANVIKAKEYALFLSREKNLKYINGYDAVNILAGQGTVGLEILEQVPDVDAVLVPVGGGGLLAGVSVAIKTLKPSVKVIGVQAKAAPAFTRAHEAGHLVDEKVEFSLADGLSVTVCGCNSFATAHGLVDKMITVDEDSIALAILRLIENEKAVVEGAGAVCLAAILSGQLPELRGKKVVSVLSGGNIDTNVLGKAIERGLAADGRLIRIEVVVSERYGGISELTTSITEAGASIKDVNIERAMMENDVFSVRVRIMAETRGKEHVKKVQESLKERYDDVIIS